MTVSPTTSGQKGTYTIIISLTDPFNAPVQNTLTIVVSDNGAPIFSGALATTSVSVGFTASYVLPTYSDPEGTAVTMSTALSGGGALPTFITLAGTTFTISPTIAS